jgi:dCMP deaminase
MAQAEAAKSGDTTKVGAVIVAEDMGILGTGYNDLPNGIHDTPERRQRPAKYTWTEHAERNAIYASALSGIRLKGASLYTNWFPCADCARAIIQVGIKKVYGTKPDFNDPKWGADFKVVVGMLAEAGVEVIYLKEVRVGRVIREE